MLHTVCISNFNSWRSHPSFQSSHPSFQSSHPSFQSSHPSFQYSHPSFQSSHQSFQSSHPSSQSLHLSVEIGWMHVRSNPRLIHRHICCAIYLLCHISAAATSVFPLYVWESGIFVATTSVLCIWQRQIWNFDISVVQCICCAIHLLLPHRYFPYTYGKVAYLLPQHRYFVYGSDRYGTLPYLLPPHWYLPYAYGKSNICCCHIGISLIRIGRSHICCRHIDTSHMRMGRCHICSCHIGTSHMRMGRCHICSCHSCQVSYLQLPTVISAEIICPYFNSFLFHSRYVGKLERTRNKYVTFAEQVWDLCIVSL